MSNKPVEPTLLHPSQFLRLVRMSSEELLRLLEQGKLPFLKAPTGELLIDLNSVTPEILARKRQRQDSLLTKNEQNLLEDVLGAEVLNALEPLLQEALNLAQDWQRNEKKSRAD